MRLSQKIGRRDFLEGAGVALAGTALGVGASYGEQEPSSSRVRFAVMFPWPIWTFSSPFSFPNAKPYSTVGGYWPTKPLREVAVLLSQLGFQGIDLGEAWALSPESILEALDGTGLVISNIGGPCMLQSSSLKERVRGLEITRKCLDLAKAVDCPKIGDHYRPFSNSLGLEDNLIIDQLRELAPDVNRTGVGIDLEPLKNNDLSSALDLQSHTVSLIQAVGAPGFKVVSDFWHMQMQKNDIGQSLTRNGNYTGVVHVSEGSEKKSVGMEPGSKAFDYRPGFRALKKWGYSGWIVIECLPSDGNPEAALARGLKYVQQQWIEA